MDQGEHKLPDWSSFKQSLDVAECAVVMQGPEFISRHLQQPIADQQLLNTIFNELFISGSWTQLQNYKTMWMTMHPCTCNYKYGAHKILNVPMSPLVVALTERVSRLVGIESLNSVNINYYAHNYQHLSWHADDEPLFLAASEATVIVSVSLGHSRDFEVKELSTGNTERVTLHDGQLLTMEGLFQKFCHHRVPSSSEHAGPRINLTWRTVKQHNNGECPLANA